MIFLNHPLVRAHFLKHGYVCTLRSKMRKFNGWQAIVHGSRFKHRPVGKGWVELIKRYPEVTPRGLARLVKKSGFASAKDWLAAYSKFNGGKLIQPAYVYEVTAPVKRSKNFLKKLSE